MLSLLPIYSVCGGHELCKCQKKLVVNIIFKLFIMDKNSYIYFYHYNALITNQQNVLFISLHHCVVLCYSLRTACKYCILLRYRPRIVSGRILNIASALGPTGPVKLSDSFCKYCWGGGGGGGGAPPPPPRTLKVYVRWFQYS